MNWINNPCKTKYNSKKSNQRPAPYSINVPKTIKNEGRGKRERFDLDAAQKSQDSKCLKLFERVCKIGEMDPYDQQVCRVKLPEGPLMVVPKEDNVVKLEKVDEEPIPKFMRNTRKTPPSPKVSGRNSKTVVRTPQANVHPMLRSSLADSIKIEKSVSFASQNIYHYYRNASSDNQSSSTASPLSSLSTGSSVDNKPSVENNFGKELYNQNYTNENGGSALSAQSLLQNFDLPVGPAFNDAFFENREQDEDPNVCNQATSFSFSFEPSFSGD